MKCKKIANPQSHKPLEFIIENILSLSTLLLKITQFALLRHALLSIWSLPINLQNLIFKYFYFRKVIHSNIQLKKKKKKSFLVHFSLDFSVVYLTAKPV